MKKSGFTIVEVVVIVVTVIVIAGIGYMAYTNIFAKKDSSTSVKTSPSPQASQTADTTIGDTSDLDKVDKQLNDLSIDDGDASQLDSSTSGF